MNDETLPTYDGLCVDCGRRHWGDQQRRYCSPCRAWRGNLKSRASLRVAAAIARGELAELDGSVTCADCDLPAVFYDHRDYSKPLDVEPVCRRHNRIRPPGKVPSTPKSYFTKHEKMHQFHMDCRKQFGPTKGFYLYPEEQ